MKQLLSYVSLVIMFLLTILLFVTAKTYGQLVFAIVLYPAIVYLCFKLFPSKDNAITQTTSPLPALPNITIPRDKVDVVDIEKRTFLKIIGTAGLSFFIFSLLGRKAEDYIFNKNRSSNPSSNTADTQGKITDNSEYKISEIDEGSVSYYGFINKDGGWMIMKEDSLESSFRYSKGQTNFSTSWKDREKLKYDYYNSLF